MSLTNKSERQTGLLTVALNGPFTESVTLNHITYIIIILLQTFSFFVMFFLHSSLVVCVQIINSYNYWIKSLYSYIVFTKCGIRHMKNKNLTPKWFSTVTILVVCTALNDLENFYSYSLEKIPQQTT